MAHKTKTPAEMMRSTKTKFIAEYKGFRIYSHTLSGVAGGFVAVSETGWETFEQFIDAKREILLRAYNS